MTRLLFFLYWLMVPAVSAADLDKIGSSDASVARMWADIKKIFPFSDVGARGPELLLVKVITFVLTLVGGTAVCVILYAGIRMIVSRGDEAALGEAKKIMGYGFAGLIFAILADVIIRYTQVLIGAAFVGT